MFSLSYFNDHKIRLLITAVNTKEKDTFWVMVHGISPAKKNHEWSEGRQEPQKRIYVYYKSIIHLK